MVGIVGLVVVVFFVVLVVFYFVDWMGFWQDFECCVLLIFGKKVEVYGVVSVCFILFLFVMMEDVMIGWDEVGKLLVMVVCFVMDMEIVLFLLGEVCIFEMCIIELKVYIVLQKDGMLDWVKIGNLFILVKIVVFENVCVSGGEVMFEDYQMGWMCKLIGFDFMVLVKLFVGFWYFEGKGLVDGVVGKFIINIGICDVKGELCVVFYIILDVLLVIVDFEGMLRLVDLKLCYDGMFNVVYGVKKQGDLVFVCIKGVFEFVSDCVCLL